MGFDFTIALVPKTRDLERELKYIKSALLYADSVTLISPLAFIFRELTDEMHQKDEKSALKLVQQVMPFIKAADVAAYNSGKPVIDQFINIIHSPRFRGIPFTKRLEIRKQLKDFVLSISNSIYELIGEEQCKELDCLIRNNQINIAHFEHIADDSRLGVQEYFMHLNRSLHNSYPLFDEQSNDLMQSAVKAKIIQLSAIDERKILHAGMTDNFIQRLPSFETVSLDEIIDVKKELSASLVRFRSKMLTYSDSLQSLPWDNDFENECNILYYKEVAPALVEIEEATKENSFIKNLGNKFFFDENAWKSAGGIVVGVAAAGVITSFNNVIASDTSMLVAGGAMVASKIASAYADYSNQKKVIEKKDLFFYYKAGKLFG